MDLLKKKKETPMALAIKGYGVKNEGEKRGQEDKEQGIKGKG